MSEERTAQARMAGVGRYRTVTDIDKPVKIRYCITRDSLLARQDFATKSFLEQRIQMRRLTLACAGFAPRHFALYYTEAAVLAAFLFSRFISWRRPESINWLFFTP